MTLYAIFDFASQLGGEVGFEPLENWRLVGQVQYFLFTGYVLRGVGIKHFFSDEDRPARFYLGLNYEDVHHVPGAACGACVDFNDRYGSPSVQAGFEFPVHQGIVLGVGLKVWRARDPFSKEGWKLGFYPSTFGGLRF